MAVPVLHGVERASRNGGGVGQIWASILAGKLVEQLWV